MVSAPTKPQPTVTQAPTAPLLLRLPEEWQLNDDCVARLSDLNEGIWFERTAEGTLRIVPPPGNRSSVRAGRIFAQISHWELDQGRGFAAPADGGFHLPDSSLSIPDASWISDERLAAIDDDDEQVFVACPDFVLEVRSPSRSLQEQQTKMAGWIASGVRLGWLLDAFEETVWVYREGQPEPERLERPMTLSGESVMEGLSVDLTRVWRQTAPAETPSDS